MITTLVHRDAQITVEDRPNEKHFVRVLPRNENAAIPFREWETAYPIQLIQLILNVKGPGFLCDELMRDEDPHYLQLELSRDLRAYFNMEDLAHKRILDFGCGSGASTVILARMFPMAEIVGVELLADLLNAARERIKHYGFSNVRLTQSPGGTELPPDIGSFDLVVMSAVYEHLLPEERNILMPKLWRLIHQDGHLFINQTPNLMCPIEGHTTGLPLVNYLPRPLAQRAALRFSHWVEPTDTWEILLRKGIRGATEREILGKLKQAGEGRPLLIEPGKQGFHDRIDLWYSALNLNRMTFVKRLLKIAMKGTWYGFGFTFMPNLTMVIQKAEVKSS